MVTPSTLQAAADRPGLRGAAIHRAARAAHPAPLAVLLAVLAVVATACRLFSADIPCPDGACPTDMVCVAARCVDPTAPGGEGEGEGEGSADLTGHCGAALDCLGFPGCGDGCGCLGEQCRRPCGSDGDCIDGQVCGGSSCGAPCSDDDGCRADQYCATEGDFFSPVDVCRVGCRNGGCGAGKICSFEHACEPPASSGGLWGACNGPDICDAPLNCVSWEGTRVCTERCSDGCETTGSCCPLSGLDCIAGECSLECHDCVGDACCAGMPGFTCLADAFSCFPR